jgi:hypothetical protein
MLAGVDDESEGWMILKMTVIGKGDRRGQSEAPDDGFNNVDIDDTSPAVWERDCHAGCC